MMLLVLKLDLLLPLFKRSPGKRYRGSGVVVGVAHRSSFFATRHITALFCRGELNCVVALLRVTYGVFI